MRTSANRSAWLIAAAAALLSSAGAARAEIHVAAFADITGWSTNAAVCDVGDTVVLPVLGEFSCMSIQPGAAQWLDDVADLIERHGYKFWTFHSYGEFYGWNLETIRDAGTGKLRDIRDGETTDRLEVMKKHWAKNRE